MPAINHRRVLGEARKLLFQSAFSKGGHKLAVHFADFRIYGLYLFARCHELACSRADLFQTRYGWLDAAGP